MEFVHESVVERGEVFEAFGAGFLEPLKEIDLSTRVNLLEEMAELSHRVASCRDTQHIVHETLDKLLRHVFAGEVPIGEFS